MKRGLFLYIAVLLAVLCPAQQQAGYVKTPGRLGPNGELIAGQRIAGATLYFRDISTIGSGGDGSFTFAVPGKSFMLTRVQKNGYELADRDLLGRTHTPSPDPFIVVMDTPDAILAQRLAGERRLRRTLNEQLRAREDEIEALKKQQRITEDDYHKKLQELYASQEKNEKLISDMAERYARMDFDQLDDFRRRVAACIQNGDLTRADSLLSTRGNLLDRATELKRGEAALHAYADDLTRRQQSHDKSVAMHAHALADFGTDSYNRAEICQLRHMNDSAAYYLELRANTDTLNAEWQDDVANFNVDFIADYNKALTYYENSLKIRLQLFDKNHKSVAVSYGNIGYAHHLLENFTTAIKYYTDGLKIQQRLLGEESLENAIFYNNLGGVYDSLGDYATALEYYKKALNIRLKALGDNHPDVAIGYNNIANIYDSQEEYATALEYLMKSLKIRLHIYGNTSPIVATCYNNIGAVYDSFGKYTYALDFYKEALKIWLNIFGENHPDVATVYNNIGYVYDSTEDYTKALEYYKNALKIQLHIFGENYNDVAISYLNIGGIYQSIREYATALDYYEKVLKILPKSFGERHPFVATTYGSIGFVYQAQEHFEKALEYQKKALEILLEIFGYEHPDVAAISNNIGELYWKANSKGVKLPDFENFTSERIFIGTFSAAKQLGINGEYIILELGNWNIDCSSNLFDKIDELQGNPKTVTVMQNNKITQHLFDNPIGIQLEYRYVGKSERQRIIAEYRKWKAQATR